MADRTLLEGVLTLEFNIRVHRKYGFLKPGITDLQVNRRSVSKLSDILDHLNAQLQERVATTDRLLLKAICKNGSHRETLQISRDGRRSRRGSQRRLNLCGAIPLVCDEIWLEILTGYCQDRLEILVDQFVPLAPTPTTGCMQRFFKRELKYLDVVSFIPSKDLTANHILNLCQDIFKHGVKIKQDLRRGVWMHLVGVFHPLLKSQEERECYIDKLRTVYDHLKGKLVGEDDSRYERRQLADAVHRDAVRTDPGNPFFANFRRPEDSYISQHYHQTEDEEDNNIQKLINIIVIYTLEHDNISYTQGMTDILSPILYIMDHEADAYICFAAMVERIQLHFQEWCAGTLYKLERLRHLCQVLDPELYQYLTNTIEEDAFVLFFGMVLIECRREFSFQDSFHLLETIWAGSAFIKNGLKSTSDLTHAQWARFMSYESPEVLQQVFERSGVPYRAVPLPHTMSGSFSIGPLQYSRNPSLASQSPPNSAFRPSQIEPYDAIAEHPDSSMSVVPTPMSINDCSEASIHNSQSDGHADYDTLTLVQTMDSRARSQSDPMIQVVSSSQRDTHSTVKSADSSKVASPLPINVALGGGNSKLGNSSFSHSESELYDSFSNSKIVAQAKIIRHQTELSDMSSMSSGGTTSGNLISSLRSIDSHMSSTRNFTPDRRKNLSDGEPRSSTSSENSSSDSDAKASHLGAANATLEEDLTTTLANILHSESPSLPQQTGDHRSTATGSGDHHSTATGSASTGDHHSTATGSASTGDHRSTATGSASTGDHRSTATGSASTGCASTGCASTGDHHSTATGRGGNCHNAAIMTKIPLKDSPATAPLGAMQQSPEVIEHGGRITSISQRNYFDSQHGDTDDVSVGVRHRPPQSDQHYPHSDGDITGHRSTPKRICGRRSPLPWTGNATPPVYCDDEIPSSHRVTPVAFFDAMEKLAESAPTEGASFPYFLKKGPRGKDRVTNHNQKDIGNREEEEEVDEEEEEEEAEALPTYRQNRQRTSSDAEISLIMSQLISTEQGAPRVSREDSLNVPFHDCYSLFICLSILVQNRNEIIRNGGDFYHLSMILNSQAGVQDLDVTLKVALSLYKTYRQYQEMCFGGSGRDLNTWLDDTGMGAEPES